MDGAATKMGKSRNIDCIKNRMDQRQMCPSGSVSRMERYESILSQSNKEQLPDADWVELLDCTVEERFWQNGRDFPWR